VDKPKIFVLMPFDDESFEVYEMLKIQFEERFDFSNAADEANQQNILKDIIQPIFEADIVVADLTGLNANVMYELGLAHSFNKKTIIITRDELSQLPFDLKQYRAKNYNTHFKKFAELIDYLSTNFDGAINNSVAYSNPVKDFLSSVEITTTDWFSEEYADPTVNDLDKGFVDFLADLETNTDRFTATLTEMTNDMHTMSDGMNKSTAEIQRVNKTGGTGTAAFVRKEAKKVANVVRNFSTKLRQHNKTISLLWDEIEKSTLGLMESKFVSTDDNKSPLIEYIKSLFSLKRSIVEGKEPVETLKTTMHNNLGIERTMNQSIRFLEEDLTTYLTICDQICASIEKIIEKSKFVVGTIDFEE